MVALKTRSAVPSVHEGSVQPLKVLEIELGQLLPSLSSIDEKTGQSYEKAYCLVRLHSHPLGTVEFPLTGPETSPDLYLPIVWQALGEKINRHLEQDGLPRVNEVSSVGLPYMGVPVCLEERERFLAEAPFVSVIIPTHDRVDRFEDCLRSILAVEYPQFEIVIIDNVPSDEQTKELVQDFQAEYPNIVYEREMRQGPSWARNRGIEIAQGEIFVFVDDDVIVDRYWLVDLIKAFTLGREVVCVSSLILPMRLDSASQIWFEEYGGFCKGFVRKVYDMGRHRPPSPVFPYSAGIFGTGASMAFRPDFIRSVGGFDPALGGSGPSRCGEDLAVYLKAITQGYKIVYEPTSLLYHLHRTDYQGLRKQIYNYGIGLTAYLTKSMMENPKLILDFLFKVPRGFLYASNQQSGKNSKKSWHYPKELTKLELKGMLYGPLAYLQSRKMMKPLYKAASGRSVHHEERE